VDVAVRRAFRWNDTTSADVASAVTGFALAPAAALGVCEAAAAVDDRAREGPGNALVVIEAVALASGLDSLVKLAVARQRPFAHYRDPARDPAAGPHPDPDENLSFYSGHTTLDVTLAVASGTVASMRGYRLAPAVWAASLPVAVLTGYLRIAADKHYFTDVLTGALLGAAIGAMVPLLFHGAPVSGAPGQPNALNAKTAQAQTPSPFIAGSWNF
jgi:hypothetical protein